jgi:DedD protein
MQREPSGDQELIFKKRARRRLVGAIALVLLMVIVLPMVLKDRAVTDPQEQITITLPGEHQTTNPDTPSDFDSNIVPTEPPKGDATTAQAVPAHDAEATIVKPSKEESTTKPKDEANHKFYVQIGVFSDEANVKQLQAKLSGLGYKSLTEKISTDKGQKIRLRTQILGDRNEAAIALENIKDAGLTGMVVSQ